MKNKVRKGLRIISFFIGFMLFSLYFGHIRPLPPAQNDIFKKEEKQGIPVKKENTPAKQTTILEQVLLPVENIAQLPELPNGCEATSLAILMRFWGYPVSKNDVAYRYMPRQDFYYRGNQNIGANPEIAYPGDPGVNKIGFYCYPPVVTAAYDTYLNKSEQPAGHTISDISGAGLNSIFRHLSEGSPVIVWVTINYNQPDKVRSYNWRFPLAEEAYTPYANLHVMVVRGYDKDFVYLCDPLLLNTQISRTQFKDVYESCGQRAVVMQAIE